MSLLVFQVITIFFLRGIYVNKIFSILLHYETCFYAFTIHTHDLLVFSKFPFKWVPLDLSLCLNSKLFWIFARLVCWLTVLLSRLCYLEICLSSSLHLSLTPEHPSLKWFPPFLESKLWHPVCASPCGCSPFPISFILLHSTSSVQVLTPWKCSINIHNQWWMHMTLLLQESHAWSGYCRVGLS